MKTLVKKIVSGIDWFSDRLGHMAKYLILALIFVLCFEVISRYVFNSPTIWVLETSKMLFGAIGALCWGYTLKIGGHVRVDVFYSLFPKKVRAIIDVVMTIILLIPFEIVLITAGFRWAFFALKTNERMVDSSWLPPSAPFRFVLAIGFTFFLIQTLAELMKNMYFLLTKEDLIDKGDYVKEDML